MFRASGHQTDRPDLVISVAAGEVSRPLRGDTVRAVERALCLSGAGNDAPNDSMQLLLRFSNRVFTFRVVRATFTGTPILPVRARTTRVLVWSGGYFRVHQDDALFRLEISNVNR